MVVIVSNVSFSLLFVCDVDELLKVMNRFYKRKEMQKLAADHGLDGEKAFPSLHSCQYIVYKTHNFSTKVNMMYLPILSIFHVVTISCLIIHFLCDRLF